MELPTSTSRFWSFFATATLVVVMLGAIRWSFDHPYGIHWDEAQYLNDVQIDVERLRTGRLLSLGGRLLLKSWGRPPAFRFLALPFLALFGFHTFVARLVSLACFGLSAEFIYLAARRIGSHAAGAIAVCVFALSPEVVSASAFFSTEAPLFLATSGMLYYLFLTWSDRSERTTNWIGLGLAMGLGLLSKTSFVLIALPVLVCALILGRYGRLPTPGFASQCKAGMLAFFIAAPWWLPNVGSAFAYARFARGTVRNSLGQPSLLTWLHWLSTVFKGVVGHALSILIGMVIIALLRKVVAKKEFVLEQVQKAALTACASAGLPLLLLQISSTNHLLRYITPSVIPFAIAVGVLAERVGWTRSIAAISASGLLVCVQLIMIVGPVVFPNSQVVDLGLANGGLPWRTLVRFDQWDWSQLQDIAHSCGIVAPRISYLGAGRVFNPPEIEYPWVTEAASARLATLTLPEVTWLWRYEDGLLDWKKVMDSIDQSDIVLTAPGYVGETRYKENLDNQYNAEFADRLSRDPRFRGPTRLAMGRFKTVEVLVWVKSGIVCRSATDLN
jgi:4-amino-4-deoxy-L-arabinose transferase-like glycosyltransferase